MNLTVAVLSPGDMGHSIASVLRHGGVRVVTCLEGRSDRTRVLAAEAGVEALPNIDEVVQQAEIILSVLVPAQAGSLAKLLADAIRRTGARPLVADCNAIAPATVGELAATLEAAGARFVDAGIIGSPPTLGARNTRIYASGEHASQLEVLNDHGLDVRVIGSNVGQASGLKMCYAALTKGLTALGTELHVAADVMGLSVPLREELAMSQPVIQAWLERLIPAMPPKAYRWVGEMEEIAATFESTGLTPRIMLGAADIYRLVEASSLGQETPELRTKGTSLIDVTSVLAQPLKDNSDQQRHVPKADATKR